MSGRLPELMASIPSQQGIEAIGVSDVNDRPSFWTTVLLRSYTRPLIGSGQPSLHACAHRGMAQSLLRELGGDGEVMSSGPIAW